MVVAATSRPRGHFASLCHWSTSVVYKPFGAVWLLPGVGLSCYLAVYDTQPCCKKPVSYQSPNSVFRIVET